MAPTTAPRMMWIVPKAGLNIRNPYTRQLLPVGGDSVPELDQHWNRCLISGDVTLGTAPAVASSSSPIPLELPATPAEHRDSTAAPATSRKR